MQVNSPEWDYAPAWHPSGDTLFFVSTRYAYQKLWYTLYANGSFDSARLYPSIDYRGRITGVTFDHNGKMYLSASKGIQRFGPDDIFDASEFTGDGLRDLRALGMSINSTLFERGPSVSGSGDMMIFASNRGNLLDQNNFDLYVSTLNAEGEWSDAERLGDEINSPGAEDMASLSPSGNILYFSRWYLDKEKEFQGKLLKSKRTGPAPTDWSVPELLPKPFNTDNPTYGFAPHPSGKFVVVATSRPEVEGGVDLHQIIIKE